MDKGSALLLAPAHVLTFTFDSVSLYAIIIGVQNCK